MDKNPFYTSMFINTYMADLELSGLSENVFPYSHSKPRLICNQQNKDSTFFRHFYFYTQVWIEQLDGNSIFVVNIAYILSGV